MKSYVFQYFVLINTLAFAVKPRTYQLELVQVLFRHGDRIPDKGEVYKTDPYDPDYYEPIGYGQLTKIGMQREYQVGQILRMLYKDFLGEFKSDKVYGYSSDLDRTKASLQLVLAGLFPPLPNSAWNMLLKWTPIPTHYKPTESDFLTFVVGPCGGFPKLQEMMDNVPEIQQKLSKYEDFLNYVQNKTEIGNTNLLSITLIASNLRAIRSMGLPLPSWCSEQDYKKFSDLLKLTSESLTITPELRKFTAGLIVKQILDNMKNHKKNHKRKIYLYGGHDLNISPFIGAHNFTSVPAIPDYGSAVIIEKLRGSDNESYVRMYLWTGVTEKLILLKLENCEYDCPLSVYEKMMTPVFPGPDLVKCFSESTRCGKQKRNRELSSGFTIPYGLAGPNVFNYKYGNEVYVEN